MTYKQAIAAAVQATAAVAMVVGSVGAALPAAADHGTTRVRVPHCAEDESLLLGRGNFDGRVWDRYLCVNPDDLTAAAKTYPDIGAGVAVSICEHRRYWKREFGIGPIVSESCDH